MTPTTSNPSGSTASSTSGECVVCGKSRTTRCSACASNGCNWIFFCSTEHQKLSEAAEAGRLLSISPHPTDPTLAFTTALASPDGRRLITAPQLESAISTATQGSTRAVLYPELRYTMAAVWRRQIFCLKALRESAPPGRPFDDVPSTMMMFNRDLFGAMARFIRDFEALYPKAVRGPSSVDPLLHKILAHFSILATYYKDTAMLEKYRPLLDWTKEEVLRYCRETLIHWRPAAARTIQQDLLHSFSATTYLPLNVATDRASVWAPQGPGM